MEKAHRREYLRSKDEVRKKALLSGVAPKRRIRWVSTDVDNLNSEIINKVKEKTNNLSVKVSESAVRVEAECTNECSIQGKNLDISNISGNSSTSANDDVINKCINSRSNEDREIISCNVSMSESIERMSESSAKSTGAIKKVITKKNESSKKNDKSMPLLLVDDDLAMDTFNSAYIDRVKTLVREHGQISDEENDGNSDFVRPKKTTRVDNLRTPEQQPTLTKNKFGLLDTEPTNTQAIQAEPEVIRTTEEPERTQQSNTQTTNKRPWVPPIVINQKVACYKTFISTIRETLGHDNFSTKFTKNQIKIITRNNNDHDLMVTALGNSEADFFTYLKPEEKTRKIVMKGAPNMDINDIKDCMKANNVEVRNCVPLKGKSEHPYSYLLSLPKQTQIKDIKNIKELDHVKVNWEKYTKNTNWTQCHKCQAFGHGESTCYRKPRCVKCLNPHHTRDCPMKKTENSVPKCVNCKGDHSANYHKCPALLEYLEKRNGNRQNTEIPQQQTRRTLPPNNNFGRFRYSEALSGRSERNDRNERTERQSQNELRMGMSECNEGIASLASVMNELKEINSMIDLTRFFNLLNQLKVELRDCNSISDRFMILLRYVNIFD